MELTDKNISLPVKDMALYTVKDWLELDSVSEIIKWTINTNPNKDIKVKLTFDSGLDGTSELVSF